MSVLLSSNDRRAAVNTYNDAVDEWNGGGRARFGALEWIRVREVDAGESYTNSSGSGSDSVGWRYLRVDEQPDVINDEAADLKTYKPLKYSIEFPERSGVPWDTRTVQTLISIKSKTKDGRGHTSMVTSSAQYMSTCFTPCQHVSYLLFNVFTPVIDVVSCVSKTYLLSVGRPQKQKNV